MAAKRNKSQAKRNSGGGGQSLPGWAWLILGLVLGIGAFLLAPKFLGGDDSFFRPQPNADAKPPALDANAEDKQPIVDEAENADATASVGEAPADGKTQDGTDKEQDYAFYNLLSGEETPISDAELAAKARAEEDRAAKANREAAAREAAAREAQAAREREAAAGRNPDAANPAAEPANRDAGTPAPPAIDAVAPRPSATSARYLLQAGAFAASGDAEALKAKIAFLGLNARVESAQIKGNTVYRVRMGPYGTATELADAKRKLAGGGLQAMAVRVK
jgi:cell division protein FtsN